MLLRNSVSGKPGAPSHGVMGRRPGAWVGSDVSGRPRIDDRSTPNRIPFLLSHTFISHGHRDRWPRRRGRVGSSACALSPRILNLRGSGVNAQDAEGMVGIWDKTASGTRCNVVWSSEFFRLFRILCRRTTQPFNRLQLLSHSIVKELKILSSMQK